MSLPGGTLGARKCPVVWFHAGHGLYFSRLMDGSVTIRIESVGGLEVERTVSPDTWASIMAAVCARGEDTDTWHEARQFHTRA